MKHARAIEALQIAKDVCDTNAPINEVEGNIAQAELERWNSGEYADAIDALTNPLPSTHQIGDRVVITDLVVSGVKFTEGKVHYELQLPPVDIERFQMAFTVDSCFVKKVE
jgi:hypothetical protein